MGDRQPPLRRPRHLSRNRHPPIHRRTSLPKNKTMRTVSTYFFIKSFLLISPIWATAGAGIATLISWIFYLFASIHFSKKELKVKFSFKPIIKPLIASVIMAGVLMCSITFIKNITLISGFLLFLLGIIVYFSIMILIKGIKKEDWELVKILIKK